jgi:hypothetical protein
MGKKHFDLESMLVAMKHPIDGSIFTDQDIYSINLANNGTQEYYWLQQSLSYEQTETEIIEIDEDTQIEIAKGLLKIKYYSTSLISDRFIRPSLSTDGLTLTVSRDLFGNYGAFLVNVPHLKSFRNPEVGDIVYAVNSTNKVFITGKAAKITSINNNVITLSAAITNIGSAVLAYASGRVLDISSGNIIAKEEDGILVSFDGDSSMKLYKRPLTNYDTDIYLSSDSITGFSMRKGGKGTITLKSV